MNVTMDVSIIIAPSMTITGTVSKTIILMIYEDNEDNESYHQFYLDPGHNINNDDDDNVEEDDNDGHDQGHNPGHIHICR